VRRFRDKWQGHASVDGKKIYLGTFTDPVEAARAYDNFAREHYGEFAVLNFPEEHL
jgi:hypothetical protein